MKRLDEITFQALANSDDIQIGYSDDDIVVVDSIQKFTEITTTLISMNVILICISGKVQANIGGKPIELQKNQVSIIPDNMMVTDVMISPDFNMKAMFLTSRILKSFLREKMSLWTDMMYVRRLHIITLEAHDLLFYTHFYDILRLAVERGQNNPYRTEVIQSLLRSAILSLCGTMKQLMLPDGHSLQRGNTDTVEPDDAETQEGITARHFQKFLSLLHGEDMKRHTVEAYASELCISPKYLSVVCKKHSGKTAREWIREQVMEDIRYYLKQTDLSIKQICDRTEFPNTSFFGRYVKEHFGMTPTEFRNSSRQ